MSTTELESDRSWDFAFRAELRKYAPDSGVTTVVRKRRNGTGLRGLCRKRLRYTEAVIPEGVLPYEIVTSVGNLLLNAGITRIDNLMIGAGGQVWDATHSRIGVGNDATAAAATQTDLQAAAGAGNRQFKLVSSGPSQATTVLTWVAAFATGEANFIWNEFMIDAGTADGTTVVATALNRKVTSLGTKVSGVWTLTCSLTIS